MLTPFQPTSYGRLRYAWSGLESSAQEWEIRIELITGSGEKWGQFFISGKCFEDPILFDIHLLNGEFRRVLVEAIHRGLARAQSVAVETETQKTYFIECLKGAPVSIDAD